MPHQIILCPVDFSLHSSEAIKHALAIREKFAARLILMNMYYLPGLVTDTGIGNDTLNASLLALQDFATKHIAVSVEFITDLTMGSVRNRIIAAADARDADLIGWVPTDAAVLNSCGWEAQQNTFLSIPKHQY